MVTAVSLHHLNQNRITQRQWLAHAFEEDAARAQMADLFPSISPNSHFFSVRFPVAPQFTRSVVQLWYDTPLERPGGSLNHLRQIDRATRDYVVLDYADGQVYNLMPELQEHDETIFLWAQPSRRVWLAENGEETAVSIPDGSLPVVAAQNGNQLALKMALNNHRWLSHSTVITIPVNSQLHTAILPQTGLRYRLRLITSDGEEVILLETDDRSAANGSGKNWQPVTIPLTNFADSAVIFHFEIWGDDVADDIVGYWGNPRLVIDQP